MASAMACCQTAAMRPLDMSRFASSQNAFRTWNAFLYSPLPNRSFWSLVGGAADAGSGRQQSTRRTTPLVVCFAVQRGPRIRKSKSWKPDQKKGAGGKSKNLLSKIKGLVVPEQIYEELDAWSAWDLEFPLVPLKRALAQLKAEHEWALVLIVCRWMLSKGQGRTLGTFELMVAAHDAEGRWEDADRMWQGLLAENPTVIPRVIFSRMMNVYSTRSLHDKCLEVFETMEDMGIRPHETILESAATAYRELGRPDMAEEVVRRYPPTPIEIKKRIRMPLASDNTGEGERGSGGGRDEEEDGSLSLKEEGEAEGKGRKKTLKGGRKVKALDDIIQKQAALQVPDWYAKWLGTSVSALEEQVTNTYAASTQQRAPDS